MQHEKDIDTSAKKNPTHDQSGVTEYPGQQVSYQEKDKQYKGQIQKRMTHFQRSGSFHFFDETPKMKNVVYHQCTAQIDHKRYKNFHLRFSLKAHHQIIRTKAIL